MTFVDVEDLTIVKLTDSAVLIRTLENEEHWVPLQYVDEEDSLEEGYEGELWIAQWWAEKIGLI